MHRHKLVDSMTWPGHPGDPFGLADDLKSTSIPFVNELGLCASPLALWLYICVAIASAYLELETTTPLGHGGGCPYMPVLY